MNNHLRMFRKAVILKGTGLNVNYKNNQTKNSCIYISFSLLNTRQIFQSDDKDLLRPLQLKVPSYLSCGFFLHLTFHMERFLNPSIW